MRLINVIKIIWLNAIRQSVRYREFPPILIIKELCGYGDKIM